jgi:arylsulfatase A-like enzyme
MTRARIHFFVTFTTLLLSPLAALHAADAPSKPNILLIYTDDHGWADLGVQGADKDIRTPHLDRLARDGVRFTRGYVSAPQCVPSRCGVMTGRYQQRFGVEDNSRGPLPLSELTIAERLKPVGYLSGWVGKSHLDVGGEKGESKGSRLLPDHMPHNQGFEEYFRGELRQYYASHALRGQPFTDAPHLVTDNRFRVVVQTEAALSFLDRRSAKPEQPWFLYLAWYAPHVPLESPEPWFSKTPEKLPLKRRQALAMISAMDDGLGQIRAKLKAMGQEQNTLIFFIGDNGAPLGDTWDGSINRPMVGQKGMLAEGGIRVPFLAAWPGHWPAGATYDQPVINLDVAATAVAAAGLPHDDKLDGVNLSPFITGENESAPHKRLFWRWGSQSALLEMPYKLIKLGSSPPLLFDLTNPEGENQERNLAARHPEIVARLDQRLRAWAADLQPPGLSEDASAFSRRHEGLFAEHRIMAAASGAQPDAEPANGTIQGWIARNGVLAVHDEALVLTPDADLPKNARPFFTNSNLDFAGPVTVTLRVRAKEAGQGLASITWRTKQDSFAAHQSATFDWPAGTEWQEVRVQLPEKSHIIHIRINPAKDATGVEIQSIELKSSSDSTRTFRFESKKKAP